MCRRWLLQGFEYDPWNKLRDTDYRYEESIEDEWPKNKNSDWKEPPRENEPVDYSVKADKFILTWRLLVV
jgi:DNA-directed RNA polymerase II subunit RPB3